jgi:hypothetical protein
MDEAGFGGGCKKELEAGMAKKASDVRFDSDLFEACADELEATCKVREWRAGVCGGVGYRWAGGRGVLWASVLL